VASQRPEGWILVPDRYDDGGISGATLERPALKRLLRDIEAGLIDVVVVYKIDRLSRSLMDFSKLVDVFDGNDVTFVSVTQSFSTTTSMGRLTLNILLSFAQFEREVIGERIRDKFAASRRKGMWMGGYIPLGYRLENRKPLVEESEAKTVRSIFEGFVRTGSATALAKILQADGITMRNGRAIDKGYLYKLLNNRIYIGDAVHKGTAYPGEHEAIIPQPLWDKVRSILKESPRSRASNTRAQTPALLKGLLFGPTGCAMSPTHTRKGGRLYRYYVCCGSPTGRSFRLDGLCCASVSKGSVTGFQEKLWGKDMGFIGFVGADRGNVAVATAVLALPFMAAIGLSVDFSNMNRTKSDLQAALDAAAMAIAIKVPSGLSDIELETLGNSHFAAHADMRLIQQGHIPQFRFHGLVTDDDGMQHVTSSLKFPYRTFFADAAEFVAKADMGVRQFSLVSRISVRTGDTACVYALSRTAPRAVEAAGNTSIIMDGCVVASNSAAEDAIYVGGSATLSADCLQSSGGIDATAGLSLDCASSRQNAWPLPDPFAHLREPMPPILLSEPKKSDTIVPSGRYWNLTLDGTKTLEPGIYYIDNDLDIKGTVTGEGVVFYIKNGSVTVNGDASLSLTAPTTGEYAGMLFISDAFNTSSHTFNGNGATDLNGYLYFPKGDLTYIGNNATSSNCLRIVANTVEMSGSSTLRSDCSAELGGREAKVSGPLHYTR